jgi:RNA polymerase sigma-32 factor
MAVRKRTRKEAALSNRSHVEGEAVDAGEDSSEPAGFDALQHYFSEMGRHPLLTAQEEKEIAEKICRFNDERAKQKLVNSNLRLVVKIALGYCVPPHNLPDIIQEGNIGLLHAVRKFNPERGTRFSTYASFWVRAYILKYLVNSWSLVKVATTQPQKKLFYRLNKEKRRIEATGIIPTAQLLAEVLEVKEQEIRDMESRLYYTDISLDASVHDSESGEEIPLDILQGDEESIEDIVMDKERKDLLAEKIVEFKKKLNDEERYILENRIMAEEPVTLQKIGEHFSVSRESVRQMEGRISRRLTKNIRWSTG